MTEIIIKRDTAIADAEAFVKQAEVYAVTNVRTVEEIRTYILANTTDAAGIRDILVRLAVNLQKLSLRIDALERRSQ